MHLALASGIDSKDFRPEEFSLHYQRSLFSAMVSLVREVFQGLKRSMPNIPLEIQPEAQEILNRLGNEPPAVISRHDAGN